ncbi:hypothetical protein HT031_006618 [Scenedesmus sp. PABB004]|nr:hypothetical protein HT031_006618 [Scenedesmus sp. PABB004]
MPRRRVKIGSYGSSKADRRRGGRAEVERLTAELHSKLELLEQAQQQHAASRHEHHLLVGYCDALQWTLEHMAAGQQQQQSDDDDASSEPCVDRARSSTSRSGSSGRAAPSECQVALLEQLVRLPYSAAPPGALAGHGSACAPGGAACAPGSEYEPGAAADDRVAPRHDPFCWWRWLLVQPPFPNIDTLTLEGACAAMDEVVQELALSLVLLDGPCSGELAPLSRLKAALCRAMYLLMSATLSKRNELLTELCLTNRATGEQATEHDLARYKAVVLGVRLSRDQVADMLAGLAAFNRLHAPLLEQVRELQTQLAAGGHDGARSSMLQHLERTTAESAKLDRLALLSSKCGLLRGMLGVTLYGALTWRQLARVAVLSSPFTPAAPVLAQAVAALAREGALADQPIEPDAARSGARRSAPARRDADAQAGGAPARQAGRAAAQGADMVGPGPPGAATALFSALVVALACCAASPAAAAAAAAAGGGDACVQRVRGQSALYGERPLLSSGGFFDLSKAAASAGRLVGLITYYSPDTKCITGVKPVYASGGSQALGLELGVAPTLLALGPGESVARVELGVDHKCISFVRWHTNTSRSVSIGSQYNEGSTLAVVAPLLPSWELLSFRGTLVQGALQQLQFVWGQVLCGEDAQAEGAAAIHAPAPPAAAPAAPAALPEGWWTGADAPSVAATTPAAEAAPPAPPATASAAAKLPAASLVKVPGVPALPALKLPALPKLAPSKPAAAAAAPKPALPLLGAIGGVAPAGAVPAGDAPAPQAKPAQPGTPAQPEPPALTAAPAAGPPAAAAQQPPAPACEDRASGPVTAVGVLRGGAAVLDHTPLLADSGPLVGLSLYFSPDLGCVRGAKAVHGRPGAPPAPGMLGSSAGARETALKLAPGEAITRVEAKARKCIEYVRLTTSAGRSVAAGTAASPTPTIVATPTRGATHLVGLMGAQDPAGSDGRPGALQQLQLVWGTGTCQYASAPLPPALAPAAAQQQAAPMEPGAQQGGAAPPEEQPSAGMSPPEQLSSPAVEQPPTPQQLAPELLQPAWAVTAWSPAAGQRGPSVQAGAPASAAAEQLPQLSAAVPVAPAAQEPVLDVPAQQQDTGTPAPASPVDARAAGGGGAAAALAAPPAAEQPPAAPAAAQAPQLEEAAWLLAAMLGGGAAAPANASGSAAGNASSSAVDMSALMNTMLPGSAPPSVAAAPALGAQPPAAPPPGAAGGLLAGLLAPLGVAGNDSNLRLASAEQQPGGGGQAAGSGPLAALGGLLGELLAGARGGSGDGPAVPAAAGATGAPLAAADAGTSLADKLKPVLGLLAALGKARAGGGAAAAAAGPAAASVAPAERKVVVRPEEEIIGAPDDYDNAAPGGRGRAAAPGPPAAGGSGLRLGAGARAGPAAEAPAPAVGWSGWLTQYPPSAGRGVHAPSRAATDDREPRAGGRSRARGQDQEHGGGAARLLGLAGRGAGRQRRLLGSWSGSAPPSPPTAALVGSAAALELQLLAGSVLAAESLPPDLDALTEADAQALVARMSGGGAGASGGSDGAGALAAAGLEPELGVGTLGSAARGDAPAMQGAPAAAPAAAASGGVAASASGEPQPAAYEQVVVASLRMRPISVDQLAKAAGGTPGADAWQARLQAALEGAAANATQMQAQHITSRVSCLLRLALELQAPSEADAAAAAARLADAVKVLAGGPSVLVGVSLVRPGGASGAAAPGAGLGASAWLGSVAGASGPAAAVADPPGGAATRRLVGATSVAQLGGGGGPPGVLALLSIYGLRSASEALNVTRTLRSSCAELFTLGQAANSSCVRALLASYDGAAGAPQRALLSAASAASAAQRAPPPPSLRVRQLPEVQIIVSQAVGTSAGAAGEVVTRLQAWLGSSSALPGVLAAEGLSVLSAGVPQVVDLSAPGPSALGLVPAPGALALLPGSLAPSGSSPRTVVGVAVAAAVAVVAVCSAAVAIVMVRQRARAAAAAAAQAASDGLPSKRRKGGGRAKSKPASRYLPTCSVAPPEATGPAPGLPSPQGGAASPARPAAPGLAALSPAASGTFGAQPARLAALGSPAAPLRGAVSPGAALVRGDSVSSAVRFDLDARQRSDGGSNSSDGGSDRSRGSTGGASSGGGEGEGDGEAVPPHLSSRTGSGSSAGAWLRGARDDSGLSPRAGPRQHPSLRQRAASPDHKTVAAAGASFSRAGVPAGHMAATPRLWLADAPEQEPANGAAVAVAAPSPSPGSAACLGLLSLSGGLGWSAPAGSLAHVAAAAAAAAAAAGCAARSGLSEAGESTAAPVAPWGSGGMDRLLPAAASPGQRRMASPFAVPANCPAELE